LKAGLRVVNRYLSTRNYFIGDDLTLADLKLAIAITPAYQLFIDAKQREGFPHILKSTAKFLSTEIAKRRLGKVKFCRRSILERGDRNRSGSGSPRLHEEEEFIPSKRLPLSLQKLKDIMQKDQMSI
jgi:hypothetical protein